MTFKSVTLKNAKTEPQKNIYIFSIFRVGGKKKICLLSSKFTVGVLNQLKKFWTNLSNVLK